MMKVAQSQRNNRSKRRLSLAVSVIAMTIFAAPTSLFADVSEHLSASIAQLYNSLPEAIMILDPESGDILFANDFADQFYGYGAGALSTMNIHNINQLSQEAVENNMQQVADSARSDFIYEHLLADGTIKTMGLRSYPVDVNGTVLLHSTLREIEGN